MTSNANSGLPPVHIIREKVLMERLISGTFSAGNQPKSGITRPPAASRESMGGDGIDHPPNHFCSRSSANGVRV
jgi:hypothetical protein